MIDEPPEPQFASKDDHRRPTRHRRTLRAVLLLAALLAALGLPVLANSWWTRRQPTPPTQIFRGVIYTCLDANETECTGLVHVVKVDLAAPGIQLYLTALNQEAVAQGWQYRLDSASAVLEREHLAVVVNATFFTSGSGMFQESGDLARSVQTIVADGQVNHVDPNSYLLWFDADLTPHLEFEKPPSPARLRQVRWAVGGGAIPLWKGKLRDGAAGHAIDRRTAIGIDSERKLLWLAAFEHASSIGVARMLAQQGAQDGFLLDGGHSTTMVLGPQSARVPSGVLLRGARPVATFFGVRADPLK